MKNAIRALTVLTFFLLGCRDKSAPIQAPTKESPPAVATNVTKAEEKNSKKLPTIRVLAVDRTVAEERPVEITDKLQELAENSARDAGFQLSNEGTLAGVEIHYAIAVGDKLVANAERGLLMWTVIVTLRIEDDMGLAEDLIGKGYGEAPFVKAALPNLEKAFMTVLPKAAEQAFMDTRMQHVYLNVNAVRAQDGLKSHSAQEIWAAMRRLGELKHKPSVPSIIEFASDNDLMTATIAMGVLARIGDTRAIKPLSQLTKNEKPAIALSAAQALVSFDTKEARSALNSIAESHPSEDIRQAIKALISSGN